MSSSQESGNQAQLVSFLLGKEIFAMDVMKIQGVERLSEITQIPRLPGFVEGVINLRGEIIPIIDLRKRFNLPPKEPDKETRIMLVELKDCVMGLIVDMVYEVILVDVSKMGNAPKLFRASVESKFISSVVQIKDKLIIVLEVEELFSDSEVETIALV